MGVSHQPPRALLGLITACLITACLITACLLSNGCCFFIVGNCDEDSDREALPQVTYECVYPEDESYFITRSGHDLVCAASSRVCEWDRLAAANLYDRYSDQDLRTIVFSGGPVADCMTMCGAQRGYHVICPPPEEIREDRVDSSVERGGLTIAAREPSASFRGSLWQEHSSVTVSTDHARGQVVPVRGEIWISGGDCLYRECPIELTYLRLESTSPVRVEEIEVRSVNLRNNGIWTGEKRADETFVLFSSAWLASNVVVNGREVSLAIKASEPITGSYSWQRSNGLGAPFTRITGQYRGDSPDGELTLALDLVFRDDDLAPSAHSVMVSAATSSCSEIAGAARPTTVFDGRASSHPLGRELVRYSWYDGHGRLLGESRKQGSRSARPCFGITSCPEGPVRLEVEDSHGRISNEENGSWPMLGHPAANELFGKALATGDLNGDGYQDLVVGIPLDTGLGDRQQNEDVCAADPDTADSSGPALDAGAIQVLYGGLWGLNARRNELWHQDSGSVWSSREARDGFGSALATGDFDGDGYDDIAVGVPNEGVVAGHRGDGLVNLLYGGPLAMSDRGGSSHTYLHQGRRDVLDTAEEQDLFGSALAAGDLNGDGYDDLAVGVPGEGNGEGIVQIFWGSRDGVSTEGDLKLDRTDFGREPTARQRFGTALLIADLDRDGYDDLVIGAIGSWQIQLAESAVHLIYGSASGLDRSRTWSTSYEELQLSPGGVGTTTARITTVRPAQPRTAGTSPAAGSATTTGTTATGRTPHTIGPGTSAGTAMPHGTPVGFGFSLAVGRFNSDDLPDLAVGAPWVAVDGNEAAGEVVILLGGSNGFSSSRFEKLTQGAASNEGRIEDRAESNDLFGYSLAAGRLNNDAYDDLVVGVPGESFAAGNANRRRAGLAHVLYAAGRTRKVFDGRTDLLLTQANLPGGTPATDNQLALALALADLDHNDLADLVIGVPFADPDGISDAGMLHVVYARSLEGGLDPTAPPACSPRSVQLDQASSSPARATECLY